MKEAGVISGAGLTALRGLEDVLRLEKGESIMILGASGGIGHLAAQMAWNMGARVFAIASGEDGVSALDAETPDDEHRMIIEKIEDEYYVAIAHEMSRKHYISFIAAVKDDGCELKKLYPEGGAEARFKINRTQWLYYYCNQHGLFKLSVR